VTRAMAKDWRKCTTAAELSRRLDKLETALRRHKQDEELRRLGARLGLKENKGGQVFFEPSEVRKLAGKKWIAAELERSPALRAMSITEAGGKLSEKSRTAPDCAKSLSVGRCINLLRECFDWPKKPRNSPRQRPK
jgi:hypothetical protein